MTQRPVVIVGAGPAGMAAALALVDAGIRPLMIDENPLPGGQIYRQPPTAFDPRQARPPQGLLGRFAEQKERMDVLLAASVWGLFPSRQLAVTCAGHSQLIEAQQLILAAGAYEYLPPFPGWTLPGVMTPGAAQALVKAMRVLPGKRALVAGTGPFLLVVAEQLHRYGMEVAGVVEMAPSREVFGVLPGLLARPGLLWEGARYLLRLRRARIPVYRGHVLIEARGEGEVREAVLAPCDVEGHPDRTKAHVIAVDTICAGYGLIPRIQLAQLAGCRLRFEEPLGGWIPEVDENLETSVAGVWVAGDGGGVAGALAAEMEGALAGLSVSCRLGAISASILAKRRKPILRRLTRLRRFRAALDCMFRLRPGLTTLADADTLVCRCEELTRAEVEEGIDAGGTDLRTLKVMTRLGMGPCQGRMCWPATARMMVACTSRSLEELGPLRARPPLVPIPLNDLLNDVAVTPAGAGGFAMSRVWDVIVVGGGVIGCAVAFELAKRSVQVLLLDRDLPGRATSASAGGLWPVGEAIGLGCGVIYHASSGLAETQAGPEPLPGAFRDFLVASNARFPVLSLELREITGLDIEYAQGQGLLFLIYEERQRGFVRGVANSLPAGMRLDVLSPEEAAGVEPRLTRELLGAALLQGEHQVNPMLLAEAFKRAALKRGASFRHNTRVTALRRSGDRIVGVEVGDEFLPCGTVVNAAGAWSAALAASAGLRVPVFPVRGQVVLTETLPPTLNVCLSASTCYLAQKAHGEIFIGSTTEQVGFDVSVTSQTIRSLCRGAVRAVPLLGQVRVKRTWAGLRPGTSDELPILGPMPGLQGYLNATGGFRTGIVASPLTGEVVAQLACQEELCFPVEPFLLESERMGRLCGGSG